MTRIVVIDAGLAMYRSLVELAQAAGQAQLAFVTWSEQLQRAHQDLELHARVPHSPNWGMP